MSGGFPIDIVLFAMIALFLVFRLRSILGRRTGMERRPGPVPVPGMARPGPIVEGRAEPVPGRSLPDPGSAVGVTLQRMRSVDGAFDPAHFLGGAEAAFRMIVDAFARGDRVALRPLLSDATYANFEQAIAAHETAGETRTNEIKAIEQAAIEQAELDGSVARISVRFVSSQVATVRDGEGRPVSGSDAPTELTDLWTFERDLKQPDPAWRLTAARSG